MALKSPESWQSHMNDILKSPGVTVVVGEVDTGKTSFCVLLANRAIESGIATAVVDGDMGQSEIGPPATIGLGLVELPIQALSDIKSKALYFVGATSPVGHLLASATGAKRLVEKAQSLQSRLIIVDTTGLVRGPVGGKLKTYKIELLRPRHIVAIQKENEAEHFLRLFDTWEDCTIHRLPVAPGVRRKSQVVRGQRRSLRFREFFQRAETRVFSLDRLATSGTWLRTGKPLEPKYLKFAERALNLEVQHGESVDRSVFLVTSREPSRQAKRGIEELQEYFQTKSVIIVPANRYHNLVVGLMDSHLELLSLGIVRGIDFRAQTISLITPLRSVSSACSIRFGVQKIRPDGTEIGRLRPGEF